MLLAVPDAWKFMVEILVPGMTKAAYSSALNAVRGVCLFHSQVLLLEIHARASAHCSMSVNNFVAVDSSFVK